jgi:hypothetical protein
MIAASVSGPVLNGMCTALMPTALLNSSAARWMLLPMPDEPKFSWPDFDFAIAMNSCTVFTPSVGDTTSTWCEVWIRPR